MNELSSNFSEFRKAKHCTLQNGTTLHHSVYAKSCIFLLQGARFRAGR